MSQQLKDDALKLVTVRPSRPFRIGNGTFTSVINRIPLSVGNINLCLQEKAFVIEHLTGNREVALDFVNYNQYNGPSALPEDAVEFVRDPKSTNPEVEVVDENGNRHTINKVDAVDGKPIIHINLEEQKLQEEAAKAKEAKEKAAAEAKRKAQEEEKARKEYQKQHDEAERQKALDAIMKREQEKAAKTAAKTASNSSPAAIQEGFTVSATKAASVSANEEGSFKQAQVTVLANATVAASEDEFGKMNADALRKEVEGIDWSKVPEYNRVDWNKDDLNVVRGKLRAVKKAATTDAPKSDLTKSDNQQDTKKTKFDKRK